MVSASLRVREAAPTPYPMAALHVVSSDKHVATSLCAATNTPAFREASDLIDGQRAPAGAAADSDFIEDLGDEIATLAAHIHAATHRILVLIAEFDRLRGWEQSGHADCARWLTFRTGIDLGAAREKVRAARALLQLPLTSAAMARGELSFSQVRALSRVASPDDESELLELARGATTAQLERMVRAWRKGSRRDDETWERERHASRALSVFPDDDGMYVIRGRLTPEVGALLMRAIEAAGDALFRETCVPGRDAERDAAQRRADALGLLAERALTIGFTPRDCGTTSMSGNVDASGDVGEPEDEVPAKLDAGVCDCARASSSCSCDDIPISGTRAERYQVVLHVEAETLSAEGDVARSELEDGTQLSAETSRRLSCDASVIRVTHDRAGSVLDVGRKTRTISPALRRALEVRDRGCRFPGCGLRFTDAHHVTHWADGGATSLGNCLLLCRHHHRLVHECGWRIEWWGAGRPVFYDPRGSTHFDGGWQPPRVLPHPVATLMRNNRLHGARPDAWTAGVRWRREADMTTRV
jgi:hypothetical protein